MTERQLSLFKRTAELENMTKSAEELYVSQPFLSRSLKALEEELEVKLFDRIGRNIYLNPCGKAFYKRVVKIFNELDDAVKEVRDIQRMQKERLSIVTNVSLYMPGLLELLVKRNPKLIVSQYSEKISNIGNMILSGDTDFAICCPPFQNANFESIQLRYEPGVVIYPKGHWLENYDEVGIEDIRDESFISSAKGYGTREVVDLFMRENNISTRTAIETADTSTVSKYVERGLGIAIVPLSPLLTSPAYKDNYTRIRGFVGGNVALIWRKDKYMSEVDKLFIDACKEFFTRLNKM